MRATELFTSAATAALVAAVLASPAAQAAESAFPTEPGMTKSGPLEPARPVVPSVNNEAFKELRTRCEKEVPTGKASGDLCVDAAALLLGTDIPDEYREMSEDQRIKIALRLLERAVDGNNRARGAAYDWYNKTGFLGIAAYADAYRAKELMDMMVASNYPGGVLRKIRGATSILSFTSNEAEKREGCAAAKKLSSEGKLDADSAKIATEIVTSGICTGYEQMPK
jgi:hypothetical protein